MAAKKKATPKPIRRWAGDASYDAGATFSIGKLTTVPEIRAAMGVVIRRVANGHLETEVGERMTRMLDRMVKAAAAQRSHELEARRLDLLGAAAEAGDVVWAGIRIIGPQKLEAPTIEGQAVEVATGPALRLTPPGRKGSP